MSPSDSDPISGAGLMPVPPGGAGDPPAVADRSGWRWTLALAAGLVAGLAAWIGGEACLDRIKPPRHAVNSKGLVLNVAGRPEIAVADAKNAAVAFALLGAALGMGLGIAGGLTRQSVRSAAGAALVGLIVGTAGVAVMSLTLFPRYNDYKARNPDEAAQDLVFPFFVHAGVWCVVGASAGLAYGLGLGKRRSLARIALGGVLGAALGTIAYELIGAAAFPAAQTSRFVSTTWETRLFARLAVTVFAAAGVAMAAGEPRTRAAQSPV
jgi:hypothetical protein